MKILDCTLRDGGYVNNWDFSNEFVNEHIKCVVESGIEYIEMGYRFIKPKSNYIGQCGYLSDDYLNSLDNLGDTKIAIMVDAKEFNQAGKTVDEVVEENFVDINLTKLSMIRLAVTKDIIDLSLGVATKLKSKGYEVTINLMQFMLLSDGDLRYCLDKMLEVELDIIYFADSYGSMMPEDVDRVFKIMKDYNDFRVGIHLHNNTDMAFANAVRALEYNPEFIDGSVLGMGRGAGNLKLENFIYFLYKRGNSKYAPEPILDLATNQYAELKKKYKWGPGSAYAVSGFNNIHQSYITKLLDTQRYSLAEIVNMVNFISKDGRSVRFSEELKDEAIVNRFGSGTKMTAYNFGKPVIDVFQTGCDVLIVGRGSSSVKKSREINNFIKKQKVNVFECNFLPQIKMSKFGHYCFFVKYPSFKEVLDELVESKKKVIVGFPKVETDILNMIERVKVMYLPYKVRCGLFDSSSLEDLIVPADVVSMYSVGAAIAGGAKKIFLAGFDGYGDLNNLNNQMMQAEMELFFSLLKQNYQDVEIVSITKTSFNVEQKSIYSF